MLKGKRGVNSSLPSTGNLIEPRMAVNNLNPPII